jgi:hypothetical protein
VRHHEYGDQTVAGKRLIGNPQKNDFQNIYIFLLTFSFQRSSLLSSQPSKMTFILLIDNELESPKVYSVKPPTGDESLRRLSLIPQ